MKRVTTEKPCPVCKRSDWCMRSDDGSAAICARVSAGAIRQCGEAGWLHRLKGDSKAGGERTVNVPELRPRRHDLPVLARQWETAVNPPKLARLADELGLSVESLKRLRIGWATQHSAWAFPMVDAAGAVRGIRLRLPNGRKFAVKGGREGLFIPEGICGSERLLITEGPTDCAALVDLGFDAVGRPSCTGGARLLADLVQRIRPAEVVIVADSDEPGLRGAESLAAVLTVYAKLVKVIVPPEGIKDARAWKQAGATGEAVLGRIQSARARSLAVHGKVVNRGR